jgi:hypothetical protein
MTALSLGTGLFQYKAQNDMAQAQMNAGAQTEMFQRQQIAEQQRQINQQSTLEQSERMKQGMIERAQIATIAGESGALGFSSDRLIGDSYMQQGNDIASMETNRLNNIKQTEWQKAQASLQTRNTNASARATSGNLLGTGLQIGADLWKQKKTIDAQTKQKAGIP